MADGEDRRGEREWDLARTAFIAALSAMATALLVVSPVGEWSRKTLGDAFARDVDTGVGFAGKLRNDWGLRPTRFLVADGGGDLAGYSAIDLRYAKDRRSPARFRTSPGARDQLYLVVGSFAFEDAFHGAILIDGEGGVRHRWPIPTARKGARPFRVFPHGFAAFPDGSAIVAFDNGDELLKIDACGAEKWSVPGKYHHVVAIDLDDKRSVWTWRRQRLQKIDVESGAILKDLTRRDIEAANPDIDPFGVRQIDRFGRSDNADDPFHSNDVDPLPSSLAPLFPMFDAGDLLISLRSLNLVLVVDPETLKIKWHASGYWRRQHDPDWGADGRIHVYNNNMHRGASSIVAIDPATMRTETTVRGEPLRFYSRIRGKHHRGPDGAVALAVADQGRALALSADGAIIFELINRYDDKTGQSLVISDFTPVDPAYFAPDAFAACGAATAPPADR